MPWRLLWRNIAGHPVRASLTLASVALAAFLISMLHAISSGLGRTVSATAANRLLVQSAVSLFVDLPLGYQPKIAQVPGVEAICKWQWFGGRYEQDKGGFFAQFAVDPETFFVSYPEMTIIDGDYAEFVKNRSACVVGRSTAAKYGWQVGQRVPILGTIFTRLDGKPWEFTIAGIYQSSSPSVDEQSLYFHFEYLRQSMEQGAAVGPDGVGVYMVRLAKGADPVPVQQAIDGMFANGPQRVIAMTEAQFTRQFITMLGNLVDLLPLVGGAVVFAIFFAVLNTMLLAGRERTRDLGVLKALGFTDRTAAGLLVAEALALCALGAGLGIGGALLVERPIKAMLESRLPGFGIDTNTFVLGAAVALGTGLLSGLLPGWRAARLSAVTAIREVA